MLQNIHTGSLHQLSSCRTHRGQWTWNCVMCDFQNITSLHAMCKGKAISEDVQWIIIWLSTNMRPDEIAMYTSVSVRSIERILAHFRHTHTVPVPKQSRGHAPKKLGEVELKVSVWLLYYSLLMTLSCPAHVQGCQQRARHLPRWIADGAAGDVWG